MSNAVNAADTLVLSVSDLGRQQVNLQRDHIKNENRVNYATEAAIKAKAQADNANTELYHLNKGINSVLKFRSEFLENSAAIYSAEKIRNGRDEK
jgi:hypothetical protein